MNFNITKWVDTTITNNWRWNDGETRLVFFCSRQPPVQGAAEWLEGAPGNYRWDYPQLTVRHQRVAIDYHISFDFFSRPKQRHQRVTIDYNISFDFVSKPKQRHWNTAIDFYNTRGHTDLAYVIYKYVNDGEKRAHCCTLTSSLAPAFTRTTR